VKMAYDSVNLIVLSIFTTGLCVILTNSSGMRLKSKLGSNLTTLVFTAACGASTYLLVVAKPWVWIMIVLGPEYFSPLVLSLDPIATKTCKSRLFSLLFSRYLILSLRGLGKSLILAMNTMSKSGTTSIYYGTPSLIMGLLFPPTTSVLAT
jgi:hypothetical protein